MYGLKNRVMETRRLLATSTPSLHIVPHDSESAFTPASLFDQQIATTTLGLDIKPRMDDLYNSSPHRFLPARRRATRRRGIAHRELASSARHPGEIPSTKSKTGDRDRVYLGSTYLAETLSQY
jgi:hypothetical protein